MNRSGILPAGFSIIRCDSKAYGFYHHSIAVRIVSSLSALRSMARHSNFKDPKPLYRRPHPVAPYWSFNRAYTFVLESPFRRCRPFNCSRSFLSRSFCSFLRFYSGSPFRSFGRRRYCCFSFYICSFGRRHCRLRCSSQPARFKASRDWGSGHQTFFRLHTLSGI